MSNPEYQCTCDSAECESCLLRAIRGNPPIVVDEQPSKPASRFAPVLKCGICTHYSDCNSFGICINDSPHSAPQRVTLNLSKHEQLPPGTYNAKIVALDEHGNFLIRVMGLK